MTDPLKCCFLRDNTIPCGKDAVFDVHPSNRMYEDTQACEEHLGALIPTDDAPTVTWLEVAS